jgi:hypothetical protein
VLVDTWCHDLLCQIIQDCQDLMLRQAADGTGGARTIIHRSAHRRTTIGKNARDETVSIAYQPTPTGLTAD